MIQPTSETGATVTLSQVLSSRRADKEATPLLRSGMSECVDNDVIDIPLPVAGTNQDDPIRVLHVDDDPHYGELTKTCLERVDDALTVVEEKTVVEALVKLDEGEFDCVVSDYDMPNTDGIEFLEIVRERHPDLPFILFTGKGSEEVASEAISKGVTDYMQKGGSTDSYEVLANRVRNAVEQYRSQKRFWNALTWYQHLVEQDIAGVFIVQDEEFIYVNERLADLFGYAQSELVGDRPRTIASGPADEADIRDALGSDHDVTDTFRIEFTGQRADGVEIAVEAHGGGINYEGEPGCIGVLWRRNQDATDGTD